jgi:putative addiction module component (TIGR02574 family)
MSIAANDIAILREELLALPASTRALLARDLADSLDSAPDKEVEDAWLQLAERRLDELKSGQVKPVPGPAVLEHVRNRNR